MKITHIQVTVADLTKMVEMAVYSTMMTDLQLPSTEV